MLISKCHLNVNVDSKNEKPLSRHSGMLLSRINSFGTNLNRLCLVRRVNHTDVVHNPVTVSLKVAGSQPEARWDDMFVYALLVA